MADTERDKMRDAIKTILAIEDSEMLFNRIVGDEAWQSDHLKAALKRCRDALK